MLKILHIYLMAYEGEEKLKKTIEDDVNNHVLFSLIWSLGAVLEENSRKKFSHYISRLIVGDDVVKDHSLEIVNPQKGKPW